MCLKGLTPVLICSRVAEALLPGARFHRYVRDGRFQIRSSSPYSVHDEVHQHLDFGESSSLTHSLIHTFMYSTYCSFLPDVISFVKSIIGNVLIGFLPLLMHSGGSSPLAPPGSGCSVSWEEQTPEGWPPPWGDPRHPEDALQPHRLRRWLRPEQQPGCGPGGDKIPAT